MTTVMKFYGMNVIVEERSKPLFFFDSTGKVCTKRDAVRAIIEESDKDGNVLQTTYCKIRK